MNVQDFEFLFLDEQSIYSIVCAFGLVFCGGFMLSVVLHLISYGVFGLLSLLNINK